MSARLSARCPQCQSPLSFTAEEAQSPIRCGSCGRTFQVRSAAARPQPTAPTPVVPTSAPSLDGLSSSVGLEWPAAPSPAPVGASSVAPAAAPPPAAPSATNNGVVIAGLAAMLSVSLVGTLVLAYMVVAGDSKPSEVAAAAKTAASVQASSPAGSPSAASGTSATTGSTAAAATSPAPAATPVATPAETSTAPAAPAETVETAVAPPVEDRTATKVVKLPAAAEDACIGGAGRYLILNLASVRQLAVFDVEARKVVKYLPVPADEIRIAAGRDKLYVFYVEQSVVARYDLKTLEKEVTLKLPISGRVRTAVMGSASNGPILVTSSDSGEALGSVQCNLFQGGNFKDHPLAKPPRTSESVRDVMHYRAAPDGRSFGRWCTSHTPGGFELLTLTDDELRLRSEHQSVGHVTPTGNGYLLCGTGVYTEELKPVGRPENRSYRPRYPDQGGLFYITSTGEAATPARRGETSTRPGSASVRMISDGREIAILKDMLIPSGGEAWASNDFTADKRVLFNAEAKSIVVIPTGTTPQLILYPFDLDAALDESGVDYLYTVSLPPAAAPGKPYSYQIVVKSKRGKVKYTLDAGPNGLKLSPAGLVTWTPPARFDAPAPVVITVSDATGQEVFHTFRVVPGAPEEVVAAASDAPAPASLEPAPESTAPTPDSAPGKPEEAMEPAESEGPAEGLGDLELKPSSAADGAVVRLPGTADDVCYAGGGRFLLLRIPSMRQIAVLDFVLGKVVKYLPLPETGAIVAGGLRKFYVVSPDANVFQRWDLKTLEKEATSKNPVPVTVSHALLGHSSDGPMFIAGSGGSDSRSGSWGFIDPRTMKPVDLDLAKGAGRLSDLGREKGLRIRISGDGKVITGISSSGLSSLVVGKSDIRSYFLHDTFGILNAGPTGIIYTAAGLFSPELRPIGQTTRFQYWHLPPVPAAEGPWYVSLVSPEAGRGAEGGLKASIRLPGEERFRLALPPLKGLLAGSSGYNYNEDRDFPFCDRIHLVPTAGVLGLIPATNDQVVLHRIDVKKELEAGGEDYLLVVSRPPTAATRRTRFRYAPEVWSKKGGVKLKLDGAPPGMRIIAGAVDWDVPAKFPEKEVNVLVLISDASGQETFHTFALTIRDPIPATPKK